MRSLDQFESKSEDKSENQLENKVASVPPLYFEQLYQTHTDPWQYETSDYEQAKYAATLAALPRLSYQSALEIGGSIGVLTYLLADRCRSLLSIDVSPTAQARAKQRCQFLPQVQFQLMQVPQEFPAGVFDLILVSEVGYYLCDADFSQTQDLIWQALEPKGQLVLIHWRNQAEDFHRSGEQVHESFRRRFATVTRLIVQQMTAHYQIDILERIG